MQISRYFRLDETQATLDFVDVDTTNDVRLYVDPTAMRVYQGDWSAACARYVQSFFGQLLRAIQTGDDPWAVRLISPLEEPNETHLGESRGRSKGRGLGGPGSRGRRLLEALRVSRASRSGLLRDLEDTALLVPNIGRDVISDIATLLIKRLLIDYTQNICRFYSINMTLGAVGAYWDADHSEWATGDVAELPRTPAGRLLLVPKAIVRARPFYDITEYNSGYLEPYFEQDEIDARSGLVHYLKNGQAVVYKRDLRRAHGGEDKPSVVAKTEKKGQALEDYRASMNPETRPVLTPAKLSEIVGEAELPDLEDLLAAIQAVAPGRPGASSYHRAVASFLAALFGESIGAMRLEDRIHGGRKRVDITADNVAAAGFFRWLSLNYHAATIVMECKNYSNDVANDELDQLAGRFSRDRGRFGLLLSRSFEDKALFIQRCKDTASDGNGFIVALDDSDLHALVADYLKAIEDRQGREFDFPLLRRRFGQLIGQDLPG